MDEETKQIIKKTPLNLMHREMGAKMVDFFDWNMPVQYEGIIEEHMAVRTKAGMFDVSHMGQIEIKGKDSLDLVQHVTCNDASKLQPFQIQYSGLMYPDGTFVDDLLVHNLGENHFFLCVNAANTEKDFQWIQEHRRGSAEVLNTSENYVLISVQGPLSAGIIRESTDIDVLEIPYYWCRREIIMGENALVSRTGYTGEDGFELYIPPGISEAVWNKILAAGTPQGMLPAGLGARDTLRLEAKMALYGNDIDDTTTPYEAGLGWITKLDKGDFLGREILVRQKEEGIKKKLVGFEVVGKGIARHGHPVVINGKEVGRVTSGSYSPYFKKNIGLTYLPLEYKGSGTEIAILIRGREIPAKVVKTPFYKRTK